jgi:ATP-dependent RNA helicase DeaD
MDERAPLENTGSAIQSYDGPERGKFGDIELAGPIAAALVDMGYETPSPIQLEALPGCLEGRDMVGQAITGSGKTAAFAIPICERVDPYSRDVHAIVLVPTRELAMQVAREVERIGKYRGISVCAVYGGQPINRQLAALDRGVNVVVGTPGRIMDHMGRGTLDLRHVRVAVLDEADEMLDIGFAEDMEFILRHTPRSRQTLLFSATVPGFVKRLIRRYQDDPMWIQLGAEIQTVDEVDQIYFEVAERDKQTALRLVLDDMGDEYRMLVFRRTQIGVDRLARALKSRGFGAMGLHGGLSQGERNQAMGMFRAGELPILVSTNVAARGIDIPEITHVVNYDMPDNVEEYVHRIGRTARMGRQGYAITFMAEWDYEGWEKIRSHIGDDKLIQGKLPIYD